MKKKRLIMFLYGDIVTDARVQRSAEALSDKYELTLICPDNNKQVPASRYQTIIVKSSFNSGKLHLFSIIYKAYKIIRKQRPDIIYGHDYYSSLLLYLLKFFYNHPSKLIYDAHELIVPEKDFPNKRLGFFYGFEKKIVHQMDLIICASEKRGQLMAEHYGLTQQPLCIRNVSQLSISDDDKTKEVLNSLLPFFERPGKTIVYAGVLGTSRNIKGLINAVAGLKGSVKLLIVGGGSDEDNLKKLAETKEKLIYKFVNTVPYKSLGAILARCDIGYVFYPVNPMNNRYCASNKIFEYASVGLPMVSNNNPTVKKELEDNHIGLSSDSISDSLNSLLSSLDLYKQSCLAYTKANTWEREKQQLLKGIDNLFFNAK